jgi:hypothetical protein
LNGNNVGTNSNSYSSNAMANGDVVTVVITSSLACASPATATSNGIAMTVNPAVVPSVSIVASPGNTICSGTNVTFTATPTNGGSPSYQWKLNGNNVGTNSNTYSNNALANGDMVTVVMTSTVSCASPTTATSNAIAMTVTSVNTFYLDSDGDGYGNGEVSQQACSPSIGYVTNNTDCDDTNSSVHPGVSEICGNGIDDNCNHQADENCTADLPTMFTRTYPVKEGDAGNFVFEVEVTLDRPAPLQLSVNYSTSNDDAAAGLDYLATQGVLTIPAGASSGIIRVTIIGDRLRESNERFWLNFSNPVNVIIGGAQRSRIMIIDDDRGKPAMVITRLQQWKAPVYTDKLDEIVIYDQNGSPVYKATNANNNFSLGQLSAGTYYYIIKVKDNINKVVREYRGVLVIMN